MNRKGSFLFGIVIAIVIFMFGMLTLNFVKDDITTVTSASALDCNNLSISDGNKVSCLAMDATIPYLFVLILSAAGGIIGSKLAL